MNTIKIRGWRVEQTAEKITFERGNWFAVAYFKEIMQMAKSLEWPEKMSLGTRILCASKKMVAIWIGEGLPVKTHSKTYWDIVDAIKDAVDVY